MSALAVLVQGRLALVRSTTIQETGEVQYKADIEEMGATYNVKLSDEATAKALNARIGSGVSIPCKAQATSFGGRAFLTLRQIGAVTAFDPNGAGR